VGEAEERPIARWRWSSDVLVGVGARVVVAVGVGVGSPYVAFYELVTVGRFTFEKEGRWWCWRRSRKGVGDGELGEEGIVDFTFGSANAENGMTCLAVLFEPVEHKVALATVLAVEAPAYGRRGVGQVHLFWVGSEF
jgi:hypothetical protein